MLFYCPPFHRNTVFSLKFQHAHRLWPFDLIHVFKFRLPSFFSFSACLFVFFFSSSSFSLSTFSMLHSGVKIHFFLQMFKLRVRLKLHNMNVPSLAVYGPFFVVVVVVIVYRFCLFVPKLSGWCH